MTNKDLIEIGRMFAKLEEEDVINDDQRDVLEMGIARIFADDDPEVRFNRARRLMESA